MLSERTYAKECVYANQLDPALEVMNEAFGLCRSTKARSPSSAILPFFWGGFPYQNSLQNKVGTNLF